MPLPLNPCPLFAALRTERELNRFAGKPLRRKAQVHLTDNINMKMMATLAVRIKLKRNGGNNESEGECGIVRKYAIFCPDEGTEMGIYCRQEQTMLYCTLCPIQVLNAIIEKMKSR